MCFGGLKEPSHRDGSFEYPQHMFWLRNKKNNFQVRTFIWRSGFGFVFSLLCVIWCFVISLVFSLEKQRLVALHIEVCSIFVQISLIFERKIF